jgi:Arc-like DNA binding domain
MPRRSKRVLPGKRYPLNMRTTKELRDKIEAAATASGRSLVQEVEARLETSFRHEDLEALAARAALRTLGLDAETARRIAAGELSYSIEPVALPEGTTSVVLIRTLTVRKPPAPMSNEEDKPK